MKKIVVWYIVWALIVLMLIGYSQFKTTPIEQLKNDVNYFGSVVTVEGYFICNSMLMLVTDCTVYTSNTAMPWDQYILLTGDKIKYMSAKTCDKVRVKGVVASVIIPTGTGFFYPELAIEVLHYGLAPSAWQYIQNEGFITVDGERFSCPRVRRKCVIKTGPKRKRLNYFLPTILEDIFFMKYLILLFILTSIISFVGLVECNNWKEQEKYWFFALLVSVCLFVWCLIKMI